MLELMKTKLKRKLGNKKIIGTVVIIILVSIGAYVLGIRKNHELSSNIYSPPTINLQQQITPYPSFSPTSAVQISVSPSWKVFHSVRGRYTVQIPLTPWLIDYRNENNVIVPEEQAATIQLHDDHVVNSVGFG